MPTKKEYSASRNNNSRALYHAVTTWITSEKYNDNDFDFI